MAFVAVGVLAACLSVAGIPDVPTDPTKQVFAASLGIDSGLTSFNRTTNGVYYKDKQAGLGPGLDSMTAVVMTFQTYLIDGSLIDFQNQQPIDMHNIHVPGLIEGMLGTGASGGMSQGTTRIIIVPSELGYANQPQDHIPANSTLVFVVQLNQIG